MAFLRIHPFRLGSESIKTPSSEKLEMKKRVCVALTSRECFKISVWPRRYIAFHGMPYQQSIRKVVSEISTIDDRSAYLCFVHK